MIQTGRLFMASGLRYRGRIATPAQGRKMTRTLIVVLALGLVLASCARVSQSRFNPFNWFGESRSVAVEEGASLLPERALRPGPVDSRTVIDEIAELSVDRTGAGGILRVTGVASVQGGFDAGLVEISRDGGVLRYQFRVALPGATTGTGAPASRAITVAQALTDQDLEGIARIQVDGRQNARVIAR